MLHCFHIWIILFNGFTLYYPHHMIWFRRYTYKWWQVEGDDEHLVVWWQVLKKNCRACTWWPYPEKTKWWVCKQTHMYYVASSCVLINCGTILTYSMHISINVCSFGVSLCERDSILIKQAVLEWPNQESKVHAWIANSDAEAKRVKCDPKLLGLDSFFCYYVLLGNIGY